MNSKETIEYINTADLIPFKNHPFKSRDGEEKEQLVQSIKSQGAIEPLIVRLSAAGKYEIISGHRRLEACKEMEIEKIPVIVRNLTDEQAISMMVDSNLHRESILPSEKAFAYKMKMEALSRQGKRTDLTSRQVGGKSEAADFISNTDSGRQVQRYIRLTYLIPEMLQLVDDGRIALTPAVELSYLSEEQQKILLDAISLNDCTPSHAQSIRMKKLSQQGKFSSECIYAVMSEEKANQKERVSFKVDDLRGFFPKNYTLKQMTDTILKLLHDNQRRLERRRNSRDER